MVETKHTPGPWTIEVLFGKDTETGNAETLVTAYANADGTEGATVATVNRWAYDDDPATPESDANARLIAAAPELLAACKLAVEKLHDNIYPGVRAAVIAAVAKACGSG